MTERTGMTAGGDSRRAQLLAVGIRAFSEAPYEDVSVEAVAGQAGIARGLLYYYFPSKREFFVAVVAAISAEMEAATDTDPALPPEVRLERGLRANVEYAERHALAFKTILRGGGSGDPEVLRIVDARRERGVARVLDGLGIEHAPGSLVIALRGWIGFFEESVLRWLDDRSLDRDQLVELLMRALGSTLYEARAIDPAIELPSRIAG